MQSVELPESIVLPHHMYVRRNLSHRRMPVPLEERIRARAGLIDVNSIDVAARAAAVSAVSVIHYDAECLHRREIEQTELWRPQLDGVRFDRDWRGGVNVAALRDDPDRLRDAFECQL
jgi:hypothetical protein